MPDYIADFFEAPAAEFRGAPFWAWNCRLQEEELLEQMEHFKEMGFGGVTIHSRTGLDTPYMQGEFMELVGSTVKKAEELGMKVYLYDEDRWPSGFGGGLVTMNPQYRARHLVFSNAGPNEISGLRGINQRVAAAAEIQGNGTVIARFDVNLQDGKLRGYRRLEDGQEGRMVWYTYLEVNDTSPCYNDQAYVDTLNREAVECFLDKIYQPYYKRFGHLFGTLIPSIFTDEPQFTHVSVLGKAEDLGGAIIPYTDDFEQSYEKAFGESFLDHLPELFFELPDSEVPVRRYRFYRHLTERFANAYSDTVGKWCNEHHICLTGHLMEEPTLYSQTHAVGEAMRNYKGFQIPGIDIVCDRREYTTAKQAQSAAHQLGRNQVTSELYGVTNWDFDFSGHKQQGDWQAALGVTHRVPHLAWVSMAGEAKRDFPASISYQSPWYGRYMVIEDYFSRINTALMSGKPYVRIGVLHPIESYWLYFGPDEHTRAQRERLEEQFRNVTEWMLFGLLDFDFISEALWDELESGNGIRDADEHTESGTLSVGCMKYDVIVVPGLVHFRASTVERLKRFQDDGGRVIFLGEPGTYVDGVKNDAPLKIARRGISVPFSRNELMEALREYREVDILDSRGTRACGYIYQMRKEQDNRILFVANALKAVNKDVSDKRKYKIYVHGKYKVELLDAVNGKRALLAARYEMGCTVISWEAYEEDSLLLYLSQADTDTVSKAAEITGEPELAGYLHHVDAYRLDEPNVMLLDQAEYALDGEEYGLAEEVLRIDNKLRERLGYPLKMAAYAQPWTRKDLKEEKSHGLRLRYGFLSEIETDHVHLAAEVPGILKLFLNGCQIPLKDDGYYVDKSIRTFRIPGIKKGRNELILEMNYNRWSNLEWCYILGSFGVSICGNRGKITALNEEIGFCDLVMQGFPFYGGNIRYECSISLPEGRYAVKIGKYRAPLLSVEVDGVRKGDIFVAPHMADLGYLSKGEHRIQIISYGSRVNTFGALHNTDERFEWFGPRAWRTTGDSFSYEYQLKRTGVLAAPVIYRV